MCNEQQFRSVQHVLLFYIIKENSTAWKYQALALAALCEHTQKVRNVLLGVHRSLSYQNLVLEGFFFSSTSTITCCEVLQPLLLH